MIQNTHTLKTHPHFFQAVIDEQKPFEIRKDDRGFQRGDILCLQEFEPKDTIVADGQVEEEAGYSGRSIEADISYVTTFAQKPGYVVMGIKLRPGTFVN